MDYIFIIFVILAWFILVPLLSFISWYRWWRENDPQGQYNCISRAKFAYFKYSYPLYVIVNNIGSGVTRYEADWWVIFFSSILGGEAKGVVSSNPDIGLCTPKTMCESLIPSQYPSGLLPGKFGRNWPETTGDWRELLMDWMGMTKPPATPEEYEEIATKNIDLWENDDNFLYAWGISPLSPIVVAYVTGWSTFGTDVVYQTAIEPLLGIYQSGLGEGSGGWFGFVQGGNWSSIDAINRAIWSNENDIPSGINQKQKCSGTSIAAGAVGTGAAGAAMGAMTPAGPIGAVIGGLIGALLGAFTGAISGNCL